MNKSGIKNALNSVQNILSKRSPEILTGIGIAGMITTAVLAVRETPKAIRLIEEKREENGYRPLSKVEMAKTCWKCYVPSVVTGMFSISCLIGANSVNARRNAALATAYKLSETAFTEYRDKVVETIGEREEQVIKNNVSKDRIDKKPASNSEIIITEKGNTLCFDSISGRYFKSDIERIKKAENELNKRMLCEMYISLNELYDELDLDHIRLGDELGWNIDNGLIDLDFSSQIAEDGTPCIVVDYRVAPKYDFSKLL